MMSPMTSSICPANLCPKCISHNSKSWKMVMPNKCIIQHTEPPPIFTEGYKATKTHTKYTSFMKTIIVLFA